MGRKRNKVKSNPIIGILCEGESEKQYFTMLKQKYRLANIKIKVVAADLSGRSLVEKAIKFSKYNHLDKTYVAFDRDEHSKAELIECGNQSGTGGADHRLRRAPERGTVRSVHPRLLLTGGSNQAVETTLLSEMPLTADQAAFQKEYTNKHGLSFALRWNDTLDEDLLFATFTVYAAFGENEAIQLVLDQNYLTENGLTSAEAAIIHVEQALDHFSPFAG